MSARPRPLRRWDGVMVTARTYNRLREHGIKNQQQLAAHTPHDFVGIWGMGKTTIAEMGKIIGRDWALPKTPAPKLSPEQRRESTQKPQVNISTKCLSAQPKEARHQVQRLGVVEDDGSPYHFSTSFTLRSYTNLGDGARWVPKPRIPQ